MKGLGRRLSAALALIECDTLADVGCDHGKAGIAAIRTGRAKRLILSDISEKSLSKARDLASYFGIDADCRVGDGMTVLAHGEADCVLIAGMGGNEIVHILDEGLAKCGSYVLVAHRDAPKLRKYLAERGFTLTADTVVRERDKFYSVIAAEKGEPEKPDPVRELLGSNVPRSADWEAYLDYIFNKYSAIRAQATDVPSREKAEKVLRAAEAAKERS